MCSVIHRFWHYSLQRLYKHWASPMWMLMFRRCIHNKHMCSIVLLWACSAGISSKVWVNSFGRYLHFYSMLCLSSILNKLQGDVDYRGNIFMKVGLDHSHKCFDFSLFVFIAVTNLCAKVRHQCSFCIFMCERSHFPFKYMHTSHVIIYVFRKVSKIIPSRTLGLLFNSMHKIFWYNILLGTESPAVSYTCLKGVYVIIVFISL